MKTQALGTSLAHHPCSVNLNSTSSSPRHFTLIKPISGICQAYSTYLVGRFLHDAFFQAFIANLTCASSVEFTSFAGSRQGLGNWVWQQVRPVIQNTKWPQVGVESIRIRNGKLAAHMVGEPIPRRISNVDLTVRLSNDYADMTLDVAGRVCF